MEVDQSIQQKLDDAYASPYSALAEHYKDVGYSSAAADFSLSGPEDSQGKVETDPLAARIAHLAPEVQEVAREISQLQHKYPIRACETADCLRAKIIFPPGFRDNYSDVARRFSVLFFGRHHAAICLEFHDELAAVAADYGIES